MKNQISRAASALAKKRWANTSKEEKERINKMLEEARAKKRLTVLENSEDNENT